MRRVVGLIGVLGLASCAGAPIDSTPTYLLMAQKTAQLCGPSNVFSQVGPGSQERTAAYMKCESDVQNGFTPKPHTGLVAVVDSIINAPAQPGCIALECGRATLYDNRGREVGTAYGTTNGGVNYFGRDGNIISTP